MIEAPGSTDDKTNKLYSGQTGRMFNYCLSHTRSTFRFEITSVIACHPWKDTKKGIRSRTPNSDEIKQCHPKIKQILTQECYDVIFTLGDTANTALSSKDSTKLKSPSTMLKKEFKAADIYRFSSTVDKHVAALS